LTMMMNCNVARLLTYGLVGVLLGFSVSADGVGVNPFVSGVDGYHTYRIPAIVQVPTTGDLLLFCEGRKLSSADHGWNDIVMKRSTDNGQTWEPMVIVYSESSKNKSVTMGNPSPIAFSAKSSKAGDVILIACRDNKEVVQLYGTNGGMNWTTTAREISSMAVKPQWTWIATGPPQGLQLDSGRLIISADHIDPNNTASHSMYSDDNGDTWHLSNDMVKGNECQAAVTKNGSLIMNQRTIYSERQFSWSMDDGETWTLPTSAPFNNKRYGGGSTEGSTISVAKNTVLLFSTPFAAGRENMTVFYSMDSGATWELLHNVNPGPAAYSALVDLNETHYGLVYEVENYGAISFFALPLPSIAITSPSPSAKSDLNMTVCSDKCNHGCKTYSTPIGVCYNPQVLFPHDEQWGNSDVLDECIGTMVTRKFFKSIDQSCVRETDNFTLPTNECIGPFGRPRPWGTFHCPK